MYARQAGEGALTSLHGAGCFSLFALFQLEFVAP